MGWWSGAAWPIAAVLGNVEVIQAVLQVSRGVGRYSTQVFQKAILKFYEDNHLFPVGMSVEMACVENWAKKTAYGLQRVVARFTRLMRQSGGSKNKKLRELKESLLQVVDFVPAVFEGSGGEDGAGENEEDGEEGEGDEGELQEEPDEAIKELAALDTLSELSIPAP